VTIFRSNSALAGDERPVLGADYGLRAANRRDTPMCEDDSAPVTAEGRVAKRRSMRARDLAGSTGSSGGRLHEVRR
jgi:hypothetical protein